MVVRLTERKIRYAIGRYKAGAGTAMTAQELGVSQRRIQQLWAQYRKTGKVPVLGIPGRKALPEPSEETVRMVIDECRARPVGVIHMTRLLKRGRVISYRLVYFIMRKNGLVIPSAAKSKKRKWVRYQRKYSNAMWHVDWHTMKDPRFRGLQLVTYLDDASRCIVASRLFTQATSENAVLVLEEAIKQFGTPATILSDNGSCFVGAGRRKRHTGSWQPTVFESELLDRGIELINARPYHPQTNGKLERLHRSIEEEIWHYDRLSSYVTYYNEDRLHFSLDIDNYQTPLRAFSDKKASKAIREGNPNWMEEDADD